MYLSGWSSSKLTIPSAGQALSKEGVEPVQGVERYIQNYFQQYDCRLTAVEGQMQDLAKQMTTQSSPDTQSLTELEEKLTDFVEKKTRLLKKSLEDQLQDMGKAVMDCMKYEIWIVLHLELLLHQLPHQCQMHNSLPCYTSCLTKWL